MHRILMDSSNGLKLQFAQGIYVNSRLQIAGIYCGYEELFTAPYACGLVIRFYQ